MASIELFTPEDHEELKKTKSPEEYQNILKNAKEYVATEIALDKLWNKETTYTIQEKLTDLDSFMKSKESGDSIVSQVQDKASEAIVQAKAAAQEEWMKIIEKAAPWAWKFFWLFDKFWQAWDKIKEAKWFWATLSAIVASIWVLLWKWKFWWKEEVVVDDSTEDSEWVLATAWGFIWWALSPWELQAATLEDNIEPTIEKKEDYFKKGWIRLLIWLSWESLEKVTGKEKIYEGLDTIIYEDFLEQKTEIDFRNKILLKEKDNEKLIKQYENISIALSSYKVKDLLRIWLSSDMVKNILMWKDWETENKEMKEALWGDSRFQEILKMTKEEDFNYRKLTIWELSLFYIKTIPVLTSWAVLGAFGWFYDSISSFIWWDKFNIKERVINSEQGLFSKELIKKIVEKGWWDENINKPEDKMIIELSLTDEKDKKDFKKIFEFKKYIFSKDFLNSETLAISEEQKEILKHNIDYKHILALYWIMWWNQIGEISYINIPIVSFFLSKVMSSWKEVMDSLESANYLRRFSQKTLLSLINEEDNFLTPDQKRVIEIYKDKMMDMMISSHLNEFYWTIWFATDKEWMGRMALWAIWAWVGATYLWNKWIKRALLKNKLPFLSKFTKNLWVAWIVGWVILWWLSIISDNSKIDKFDKDLEKAYNNKDIEEVNRIIEEHREGLKQYNKGLEKEVTLVSYEWWDPYVIYNNKVYTFEIIDKTGSIKESWAISYFINALNIFPRDTTIDGESIEQVSFEWNDLKLWDSIVIDFKNSIWNWETRELDENIQAKIETAVKIVHPDYTSPFWKWKKTEILKIWDIDNSLMLCLMPLWELEIKDQT